MSTYNYVIPNPSTSQSIGLDTLFLSSSEPSDLIVNEKRRYIINVDTSSGNYDIDQVDISNLPSGAELIFRKVTSDDNNIIDGANNHTDRQGENVCVVYNGNDLIII